MMNKIALAESDEKIMKCFSVISELRPHLEEIDFLERVKRQQKTDKYKLAYLEFEREVQAIAGFRTGECLAWDKFLYVDDLVTKSGERSKGYGQALFDWLINYAKENDCDEFHLDSAVHRFAAHRFYLQKRMDIVCHHFGLKLKGEKF